MKKPIIYIAHPIGGDVKGNLIKVGEIYRQLSLENKVIPFAPYIASISCLDDNSPKERAIGFSHNKAIFESGCIDEVWLFGGVISNGMQQEIEWANNLNIPVKQMW